MTDEANESSKDVVRERNERVIAESNPEVVNKIDKLVIRWMLIVKE